jgi:hypothetical protein
MQRVGVDARAATGGSRHDSNVQVTFVGYFVASKLQKVVLTQIAYRIAAVSVQKDVAGLKFPLHKANAYQVTSTIARE